MPERKLVSVVDDDESVRESLPDLLRSFGFDVEAFASAEEFLSSKALKRTACLILDVAMPGMTGPELQQVLARRRQRIPIVFITAHSDEKIIPLVLQRGAVACLTKPFSEEAILQAIRAAA
jgi:FixJ family two-component response regulator